MITLLFIAALLAIPVIVVNRFNRSVPDPPITTAPATPVASAAPVAPPVADDAIDADITGSAWTALDELQLNRLLQSHRDRPDRP